MLAVQRNQAKKGNEMPVLPDTASGGAVVQQSANGDTALNSERPSGSRFSFQKQTPLNALAQKTTVSSRDDPANIIGDVYIGKDRKSRTAGQKGSFSQTHAANATSYRDVVDRLTQAPLKRAELKVVMENKSYDLQFKQMQQERSRRAMVFANSNEPTDK